MNALKSIKVAGFKSIYRLDLELSNLNILIGANGSGKSNFIKVFTLLNKIINRRLQVFTGQEGGADNILFFGDKITKGIEINLDFHPNGYYCRLVPTVKDSLIFEENHGWHIGELYNEPFNIYFGSGAETSLVELAEEDVTARCILDCVKGWIVYHFHDTSSSSGARKPCNIEDNAFFKTRRFESCGVFIPDENEISCKLSKYSRNCS